MKPLRSFAVVFACLFLAPAVASAQGKAPTVPTTLVLDREGRIAVRVNGPVQESSLRGLVDDVLAES